MAWSISKDPFTELSIQQTNMLANPIGMGVPVSGKEYNVNFLLRTQTEQGIFQSFCPSGIFTRLSSPALFETHTGTDVDGELVSLVASGIPVANTFRLGRQFALVNGWKIPISNADGSNGVHNNIVVDSAPLSGTRCDLVFLEVWIAQLGGTSATISNTANKPSATTIWKYGNTQYRGPNVTDDISEVDAEINRRWQLQYRIRVVDGVSVDTYTDGVDDTVNVKAWGANPNGTWTSMTAGTGSVYTFQNAFSTLDDAGLYVAGDGSSTAKSVLGTVDGYTYAIPICAISRRNQGVYDPSVNSFGCAAAGPTGGNIASGISGRPDGLYYDQIIVGDIVSLRHRIYTDSTTTYEGLASEVFEKLIRGGLRSKFSVGDGVGNPLTLRSTNPVYGQEISTIASIDPGFKGIAPFNYQRRIFSDDAVVQQTQFTFTGGFVPDNPLPSVLSTPVTPTGSATPGTGSLAAATYYFKVTYTNSYGETVASNESTGLVLSGTGKITINSPIVNGNASGWNVYITTVSGSETKQNSSPIAIGTNYVQSSALIAGSALPSSNTSSSVLVITADSDGITNGTVVVKCVDGTTTPSTGGLPGSVNITVYNANTFALVTGTWSGLGTATAVFTPTSIWGTNDTVYGVVAVVGLSYPAGNGLANLPTGVVGQTLIQGSTVTSMQTIGVSGIAAADDAHFNQPTGIDVDSSGNIYVADRGNNRVVKYDNTLVKQGQFGVTGVAGSDNTHLNSPTSLVVDSVGNVYVTDTLNHRVVKLNSSMAYASQFGVTGISGSDTAHLNTPLCYRSAG